MRKLIFIFLLTCTFSVSGVEIASEDIINCEPSLIFTDMFALEDPGCFSYAAVSEVSADNNMLKAYLDSHPDDKLQHYFRLSQYLRSRNFFSALITFINMVNIGAADPSVMIYEREFTNIVAGGIKNSRDSKAGGAVHNDSGKLMSVKEFSTNFFAVVSYLASQDKTPATSKEDTDLKILSMAFQYTFSNFFNGIDLEKDNYNKMLFNQLIRLKNAELLRKYLQFFFYFSKGGGTVPNYSSYLSLKKLGAVRSFDMHLGNGIVSERMKKVFASFYLDNIENMPQIEFSSIENNSELSKKNKVCGYLSKREIWLNDLKYKDPDDIRYNESLKIIESCPGTFRLPFLILDDKIVVEKDQRWIVEIAIALKYLSDNDIDRKDAESILNGAVRVSLSKAFVSQRSQAADFLSYFYYTGKSSDLLFALYSKQIGFIKKDVSDPINWAADFLSSALF